MPTSVLREKALDASALSAPCDKNFFIWVLSILAEGSHLRRRFHSAMRGRVSQRFWRTTGTWRYFKGARVFSRVFLGLTLGRSYSLAVGNKRYLISTIKGNFEKTFRQQWTLILGNKGEEVKFLRDQVNMDTPPPPGTTNVSLPVSPKTPIDLSTHVRQCNQFFVFLMLNKGKKPA